MKQCIVPEEKSLANGFVVMRRHGGKLVIHEPDIAVHHPLYIFPHTIDISVYIQNTEVEDRMAMTLLATDTVKEVQEALMSILPTTEGHNYGYLRNGKLKPLTEYEQDRFLVDLFDEFTFCVACNVK